MHLTVRRTLAAAMTALGTISGSVLLLGAAPLAYPPTPRENVHDDYHGTRVPDPYRWLEDLDSKATAGWVNEQMEFSRSVFDRLPGRERVKSRLSELWNYSRTELPWREGQRIYFHENGGNEQQSSFYVIDDPDKAPRRLLNPQEISPDGSTAVENLSISPDSRWLCYGVSPGGSDVGETHIRDVTTGKDLNDVVRRSGSEACWTLDSAGFFYIYRPAPPDGTPKGAASLTKQIRYHRLGSPSETDPTIHEWTDARWLYSMLSDDGRRVIVVAEAGAISWMYAINLGDPKQPEVTGAFTPLLAGVKANHTPMGTVGDTLFVFTDLEAPRGRIIALDLTRGTKAEPLAIVPESAHVLNRATVAGNLLAVHYLEDVKSRLLLFTLTGRPAGEVALPGIGALGWALNGRSSAHELWYTFTSFLSPATVYRYDVATRTSAPFRPPRLPFDSTPYETRQVFYTSKDGTRVPMFITARKSLEQNGANPVFLTAYGGYGAITAPRYRADLPLWLERGGIYAVANLRGGGEYGEEWHRAGALERKQQSFDDFIAAAEYLVREGYTIPEKIAIYGHSNGGLLIGAVITQRPELFGVALADAGHYDMLRYQKFTVAAAWIPEYGSSDNPDQFSYLRAYSPLQNVRAGSCYPATILLTGDHDDRVVPSHAYKFAATLQAAQGCERPILLRVSRQSSHGYASQSETLDTLTDMWAFVASKLGVE